MLSRLLHAAFAGCLLCFALLSGCKGKGEDPDPGAVFRVNGAVTDSFLEVSPDAQRITLDVYLSSGSWKWYLVGNPPEWIQQIEEEHVGEPHGSISLTLAALESEMPRSAALVFQAGLLIRKVTLKQCPPDPFHLLTAPGAYGAVGGDQIWQPGRWQTSLYYWLDDRENPKGFSFRLLDPFSCKVVTLTFNQYPFEPGQQVQLLYRVIEKGITQVSETYQDVEVTRVSDSLVWLRKDDTRFIIQNPAP